MLPADTYQNRGANLAGYLNARIYVADQAGPDEIAAAANIAVRLTFEIQSLDLPVGFRMSKYDKSESSVAIIVGSAAEKFAGLSGEAIETTDGIRPVLAIPDIREAERFARGLGTAFEVQDIPPPAETPREKGYSLSSLFTSDGLLGDGDGDEIPELIETTIVLGADVHAIEVIDLAARIALEAAGCRIPLVIRDTVEALPANPILIGRTNRFLKTHWNRQRFLPGQGRIEVISLDHGAGTALSIAGADDAGESAALSHAAQRLPFAWAYGKEHLHLSHLEKDIRNFFTLRSEAGQLAAALSKARGRAGNLSPQDRASARLEVLVEGACPSSLDYIRAQFPDFTVIAEHLNVETGPLIFEDSHALPWEVHEARLQFAKYVIPSIRPGSSVKVDLRVSESPEVRRSMQQEISTLALSVGADPASLHIQVLTAHKQAFCWIDEILKPFLKSAAQIQIRYRKIDQGSDAPLESPLRWLHELYPIDEVLSRDLGLSLDRITFHEADSDAAATYELSALDASGRLILNEAFEPRYAMRTMFDAFPDYAQIRVNTGWLHATVDNAVVIDERIETDPERFWNLYQSDTLPKIQAYLLELYESKLLPECAPHFGRLEVELWLSEPDYRIGIGEERISTLEALHEDIYFETLLFFEILGLPDPGRIIPRIHRARDGEGGLARIRFTGKSGPNPRLNLTWRDDSRRECRHLENLFPIRNGTPRIVAVTVQAGHSSVVSLEITGVPDTADNRALLHTIREFHDHGIGLSWLSYEGVDALRFGSIEIPKTTSSFEHPRIEPIPCTAGLESSSIVQWDTPISPKECEQLIRRLAAFPEVSAFHAGTSYLGQSIWALEVSTPAKGKYISQARSIVAKPVLFISGRQHANEVSSTSHILKLAELLATDSETRKLLNDVHFILHPITNPDGAALADELCRDTPDFMLHAAYLGALGSDVTLQQWSENPRYPEAHVRPDLWRMWLPDIVLNPHGYPSHEWVQLFAGYTAWVKSRAVTAFDWWIPRGWFIPGFSYMEGSREAAFKIRDRSTADMRSHLGTWNQQMYERYARYKALNASLPRMQFCNDILVYSPSEGLYRKADGFTFMQRYPHVTLVETVSEVPDEFARGDWLKTLAQAGLEFSLSHGRYLAENRVEPERTIQHTADATILKIRRNRPWNPVPQLPSAPTARRIIGVKDVLIQDLEEFLQREDFGRNWDGAYQDVIPAIRRYFDTHGFETRLLSELESPSRNSELVANRERTTVHIPWAEDRNGRSVVHLNTIQVEQNLDA